MCACVCVGLYSFRKLMLSHYQFTSRLLFKHHFTALTWLYFFIFFVKWVWMKQLVLPLLVSLCSINDSFWERAFSLWEILEKTFQKSVHFISFVVFQIVLVPFFETSFRIKWEINALKRKLNKVFHICANNVLFSLARESWLSQQLISNCFKRHTCNKHHSHLNYGKLS